MKILFLCHRLPFPPDKGDKIRAFHLIRGLSKRHEVDVAALADDPADLDPARHARLREICRNLAVVARPRRIANLAALTSLPRGVAASLPYFYSGKLARRIAGWMESERYDAVVAYSAPMAQYAEGLTGLVRVADFCDVDSEKWKQYAVTAKPPWKWVYARESSALRSYECRIAREWDGVAIISAAEAALFRTFCADGDLEVVSNGVDAEFFAPGDTEREPATVLFMGAMDYPPNVEGVLWFHREAWPRVLEAFPSARFVIVGPRPTESIRALDGRARGGGAAHTFVTGYVDDVRVELARATVAVAPLHVARGVQNKVLEAMASGLPVVSTRAAHEGILATSGEDLLVADGAPAFAEAVVSLLRDPSRRSRIGASGRASVVASHSWDAFTGRLERQIERLGAGSNGARAAYSATRRGPAERARLP